MDHTRVIYKIKFKKPKKWLYSLCNAPNNKNTAEYISGFHAAQIKNPLVDRCNPTRGFQSLKTALFFLEDGLYGVRFEMN